MGTHVIKCWGISGSLILQEKASNSCIGNGWCLRESDKAHQGGSKGQKLHCIDSNEKVKISAAIWKRSAWSNLLYPRNVKDKHASWPCAWTFSPQWRWRRSYVILWCGTRVAYSAAALPAPVLAFSELTITVIRRGQLLWFSREEYSATNRLMNGRVSVGCWLESNLECSEIRPNCF